MKKNYEDLTIRDPFMFGKIVQDPKNAQTLINVLLQENIEIDRAEAEKYSQHLKKAKYVRFDLYAVDMEGRIYDAEMQNLSTNSEKQYELPWRSRYYQCMIDSDLLDTGMHYSSLRDTYIIFICDFDPFGRNKYRYTIVPKCAEDDTLEFKDGTTRIFFNLDGDMSDAPEPARNMLEYIKSGTITDTETQLIADAVEVGRENEEWRAEFMLTMVHDRDIYADGYTDGKEDGIAEGRAEGIIQGRAEGKAEGKAEGRILEIYQSVADGDYSSERGAAKLGISIEEFEKQMSATGFKVPKPI